MHIVRVLERMEAGRTPFTEAQADIRAKITQDHQKGLLQEQFDKLRRGATVWTVWEGSISGEALAEADEFRRKALRRNHFTQIAEPRPFSPQRSLRVPR